MAPEASGLQLSALAAAPALAPSAGLFGSALAAAAPAWPSAGGQFAGILPEASALQFSLPAATPPLAAAPAARPHWPWLAALRLLRLGRLGVDDLLRLHILLRRLDIGDEGLDRRVVCRRLCGLLGSFTSCTLRTTTFCLVCCWMKLMSMTLLMMMLFCTTTGPATCVRVKTSCDPVAALDDHSQLRGQELLDRDEHPVASPDTSPNGMFTSTA